MPRISLTAGDFGQGPAAADLTAFHLPDPAHPGTQLVVPFVRVAEIAMVSSDNSERVKSAFRSSVRGLLAAGPVGLAAGLLAAGKASQTVFTVRLSDGRGFTARAAAGDFAEIHAAQLEALRPDPADPADDVIRRYVAERYGPSGRAEVDATSVAAVSATVTEKSAPAPRAASFGRRVTRPA